MSFDCSLSGETSAVVQTKRVDTPEIEITLSGDVQLTAFLDADPATIADPIVITEINYKSAPEADSEDWVELYNRTAAAVDLTGWKFTDGAGHAYAFPPDTILWPESYLVLCRDKIKFKTVHPYVKNLLGNLPFGLSPDGRIPSCPGPAEQGRRPGRLRLGRSLAAKRPREPDTPLN